jgi:hypothetical protein
VPGVDRLIDLDSGSHVPQRLANSSFLGSLLGHVHEHEDGTESPALLVFDRVGADDEQCVATGTPDPHVEVTDGLTLERPYQRQI